MGMTDYVEYRRYFGPAGAILTGATMKFLRALLSTVLPAVLVSTVVSVVVVFAPTARALDNGLGRTPQLGWNNWNSFGCNVNESLIRQTADVMVSSGMAAAGYTYVNIDDCWSEMYP